MKRPSALDSDPFMKKLTVIGTIGKTQGVSSMAKPQSIASRIRAQREPFFAGASAAGATTAAEGRASEKLQSSGVRQASPLQELQFRVPDTDPTAPVTLRRWVMT